MPISKIKGSVISDSSIDSVRLDDGSIVSVDIADNAVSESKIATGAVTETKLGTDAVTEAKILDGSVSETKLGTDAVTENKILDGAVSETKLGTDVQGRMDQAESAMGFKNRIIGGNFSTNPWQRGTSFTASSAAYYADRFAVANSTSGALDIYKTADAPTIAQAGVFTQHCFHIDVTTADSSIGASEACSFYQAIEGYNVLDLGFGQSGTRYVTLSFWHKHTKTGTYSVSIRNSAANRSYVAEYTQSDSDTWEKAEITIPVDTSGTWLYTNGVGLYLTFPMAMGSTYQGTAGSWQAGNYIASTNQVNNLDSTSNNFKIALVQLEAGQTATAFENRSVGQELSLCQRYYQANNRVHGIWYTSQNMRFTHPFIQTMRTPPAFSLKANAYHEHWNRTAYTGITSGILYGGGNLGADISIVSSSDRSRSYGDPALLEELAIFYNAEL